MVGSDDSLEPAEAKIISILGVNADEQNNKLGFSSLELESKANLEPAEVYCLQDSLRDKHLIEIVNLLDGKLYRGSPQGIKNEVAKASYDSTYRTRLTESGKALYERMAKHKKKRGPNKLNELVKTHLDKSPDLTSREVANLIRDTSASAVRQTVDWKERKKSRKKNSDTN